MSDVKRGSFSEEITEQESSIDWIELPLPDGRKELACTIKEACIYLGLTYEGIRVLFNKHQVTRYKLVGKPHKLFVLKTVLDNFLVAQEVE